MSTALLERAKAAKCSALMLTLDLQIQGQRHMDLKNGLTVPPRLTAISADSAPFQLPALSALICARVSSPMAPVPARVSMAGMKSSVRMPRSW